MWTPGTLSLLSDSFADTDGTNVAPAPVDLVSVTYTSDPGYVSVGATQIFQHRFNADTFANEAWAGSTILSATTDGTRMFVVSTNGVYRAPISAAPATFVWTKIYSATPASAKIAWVKDRLMLAADQSVYELSGDPASPPAALPTALYTAKAPGWTWTDITETTVAIYAVGHAKNTSSILKFTLNTSGALPTLTGGTIACQLPGGETALAAYGYLGTFLAIGTSRGARIAVVNEQGDLTYGPLLWDNGTAVYDFAARDHWIWATYSDPNDTQIKAARIDLGLQIDTLRFAYATDMVINPARPATDATDCKALTFAGDSARLIFGTGSKTWVEDITKLQTSGWIETSRVRFNTLEPKLFRSVRVRGPLLGGSLNVAYVSSTGSVTPIYTYGKGQTPGDEDLSLTTTARDYINLRFTLNADPPNYTTGAQMFGWQIKALPGSPRQRLITLPLYCFDYESDKHGVQTGGQGFAWMRLLALENAESSGSVVTFQDLDTDTSSEVFIESVEFEQGVPPPHFKVPGSFGGRILLTMRTV